MGRALPRVTTTHAKPASTKTAHHHAVQKAINTPQHPPVGRQVGPTQAASQVSPKNVNAERLQRGEK